MSNTKELKKDHNFGYLGEEFQLKVISQIICDASFGLNIIEILKAKYFDNDYYKQIVTIIKNYNEKYDNALPTLSGLREQILADEKDPIRKGILMKTLEVINKKSLEDDKATQDRALKFCKQQEIKKAMTDINFIVEKGEFENYDKIEEILRKAMTVADKQDNSMEVTDNIEAALEDDYREPIPTGIHGIDDKIGHGLGKGELAVFLAPLGCGKTTFLSKVANTAYNKGFNVLQIFFEDDPKQIQRKHFTCWSGIAQDEMATRKDEVRAAIQEHAKNGGRLILKKCPSDNTTVNFIKQYLRYLRNKGIKIDMLIVDYLDCLSATKNIDDINASEAHIMRQLEALTSEFELRTWVGIQTNRNGIAAEVVTNDTMQGSIKRAQIAHLIITAAKTLEQKEAGLATMAITKSRFGRDGIVFRDMTFNNGMMLFDTTENNTVTQLGYEENKKHVAEQNEQTKAKKALEYMQRLKQDRLNNKSQDIPPQSFDNLDDDDDDFSLVSVNK